MDQSQRKITKIAREASKLTMQIMRQTGIGSSEFDLLHLVRHNAGITQGEVCSLLNMEKGAVSRRAKNLAEKGYLKIVQSDNDKRVKKLYTTEKATQLKNSKSVIEATFYEWLLSHLTCQETEAFVSVLNKLYDTSKKESRTGFNNVKKLLENI